jgi:hypothetical protein
MKRKTTPKAGDCALCLEEAELKESHIVPKFLWKRSGVTGAGTSFSVDCLTHPELAEPHRQDGFKEHLLCLKCEGRLNGFETYAANALFYPETGPMHTRPDRHHVWEGLDYPKLKLFQMSLLWRMGASKLPFYSHVELGKHQEILRRMLEAEEPGEPWQYGCIATLLDHAGKPIDGVFSQPFRHRKFGHHCYEYTVAGMHWIQFATSHPVEPNLVSVMLQKIGTWVLFRGEITEIPGLKWQVERFRAQHRAE